MTQAAAHPEKPDRVAKRRSLSLIFWTVILAGPFFGTVQGAAVPALAQVAHLSDRAYGYLQALFSIALLIQIPGALYVSATASRPRAVFLAGIGRILWIPAAAIPLLAMPSRGATLALLLIVGCAWMGQHVSGLAWQSLVGDLVPRRRRGRYFGNRTRLYSVAMLVTSLCLAAFLPAAGASHARGIVLAIFTVAALCGVAELYGYLRAIDPPRSRPSIRLADLIAPFTDRAFRPFLFFSFLMPFANNLAGPFLWRHLMGPVGVSPLKTTLILQTAALLGTILMAPLWGLWADRHGSKAAYILAIGGSTIAMLAWPLVSAEHWWVGLLLQFASVTFYAGVDVANTNRLLGHASTGGPGYLAAFNAANALSAFLATSLAGELMTRSQGTAWAAHLAGFNARHGLVFTPYLLLVGACILVRCIALAYLSRYIARQHPTPTVDGLKAMAMQMQTGLANLFMLPVRGWSARPASRS